MESSTANILRIHYTHPVTSACGYCGTQRRLGVIDLDCQAPICPDCLAVSIQAAEALRQAGMSPPGSNLAELNP